jgi:long-chain acyl-CoA synthetase
MYVETLKRALDQLGPKRAPIYGQGEAPMTIITLSKAVLNPAQPHYLERLGMARSDVKGRSSASLLMAVML